MVQAVERVRQRLRRATAGLESLGIPYAVLDDCGIAAWVGTVDPSAVRNSRDVDILLRRADLEAAKTAMRTTGFIHGHVKGIDIFLDGPDARARDAVHIMFACEKACTESAALAPDVTETIKLDHFFVLSLESLVKMKLTRFRRKDKTHLRDLLEVGLIDQSWVSRFPADLGARLQQLIDTPEG